MIAQYIQLGDRDWNVLVYYNVKPEDFVEVCDSLRQIGCSKRELAKAFKTLRRENTGLTFSSTDYKMSIVCIGHASDVGQFVNTAIHEAKHVQSHMCAYFGIDEDSETAAYLIGHLVHRMYKMLEKILR
jgi:hypothetical protein